MCFNIFAKSSQITDTINHTCTPIHLTFLLLVHPQPSPPSLPHYNHPSVLYIHLHSLPPSTNLLPSINCSIRSPTPIPIFPPSSHPSFLPPLVPTPHVLPFPLFSIHPSCLNNAVATQLQCHCPCFNVNVVSLSQLLGHYHPSQLIIVIQIHGQTKHITENKGTRVYSREQRSTWNRETCFALWRLCEIKWCTLKIQTQQEL